MSDIKSSMEMALSTQSGSRCTVHPNTIRRWIGEVESLTAEVRGFERLFEAAKVVRATHGVGHIEDSVWYDFAMAIDLLCGGSSADPKDFQSGTKSSENKALRHCSEPETVTGNSASDRRSPVVDDESPSEHTQRDLCHSNDTQTAAVDGQRPDLSDDWLKKRDEHVNLLGFTFQVVAGAPDDCIFFYYDGRFVGRIDFELTPAESGQNRGD